MGQLWLIAICAVFFFPGKANAYWGAYDVGNLAGLDFQYRMNVIQMKNAMRAGTAGAKNAPVRTPSRAPHSAASELALNYPSSERARIADVFENLLKGYAEIERRFGIVPGDLGGAVAAFVAGNMMALHQQPFPDEHFVALVQQMRSVVASNPEFSRVDAREQRRAYEQMAIIGMFMAGTQMALAQKPDPALQARTAAAARQYLAKIIPGDIDRLAITPAGLDMR